MDNHTMSRGTSTLMTLKVLVFNYSYRLHGRRKKYYGMANIGGRKSYQLGVDIEPKYLIWQKTYEWDIDIIILNKNRIF